jgi:hypothetical protein
VELWRDVDGYEGEYMVSNKGRIMSLKDWNKPKILKPFFDHHGYKKINLLKNREMKQVFVHRLVVEAFIGKIPEGMTVNHKDGNKTNNCVTNLEIVTQKENILHSYYVLGNGIRAVYMLDKNTFEILKEFPSITLASKEMKIDDAAIYKVCMNARNFAGGYSWMFKDDYNQVNINKKVKRLKEGRKRKKVCQIDPNTGEVIKVFPGIRVAERELGISTIKHCVSGRTKTAGGYIWRYA